MRVSLVAPLLFLSGAAALMLEVAWFRRLAQVSGATSIALGAILAAVIGGMAVGAMLFGKRADRSERPIRMYAVLELGLALIAVLSPFAMDAVGPVYIAIHRAFSGTPALELGAAFVFSCVLLALPAILMGATLPAAAASLKSVANRHGRDLGWIYGANTLGGVGGTIAAGFFALPAFGLSGTMRTAALLSGAAALGAFILGRNATRSPSMATPEDLVADDASRRRAVWLYAVSGFLGLASEVTFTRALVLVFGSTTYAFTTVLSVFLLGIGAGSLIGARLARKGNALRRLEITVAITGALFSLAALCVYVLPRFYLMGITQLGDDFQTGLMLRFALTAMVLLPGALGLGIAFPLAAQVVSSAGLGSGTGRLYGANTIASVIGSTLAVFLLVPLLGPHYAAVAVAFVVCTIVFLLSRRKAVLIPLAIIAACFMPPSDAARERLLSGVYYSPGSFLLNGEINERWWDEGVDIAYAEHGHEATVAVTRWFGRSSLLVDGKAVASEQLANDIQHLELLGHIPMAVHPNPKTVLVVGLGTGATYKAVRLHEPDEAVVVEIEEAVSHGAAYLGIKPKNLVIADARSYLKATDKRFDVITSDPIHPWVRGGGDLYTYEYFDVCKQRLSPGGVSCLWLPLYQIGFDDVKDVVRTFAAVYRTTAYFTGADLVLIGTAEDAPPSARTIEGKAGEAIDALGAPNMDKLRVAEHDELVAASGEGDILHDDMLKLEFSSPRHMKSREMPAILDWIMNMWKTPTEPFASLLIAQKAQVEGNGKAVSEALKKAIADAPNNGFAKRFAGEYYLQHASVIAANGDTTRAQKFLDAAKRLLGDDPRLLGVEADMWTYAGKIEQALPLHERLFKRYPDSVYLKRRWDRAKAALGK